MAHRDGDLGPGGRGNLPIDDRAVGGPGLIAPPGGRGALFTAARQLARGPAKLPVDEARAAREIQLGLDLPPEPRFDRPVGAARREPAGVLDHEPDAPAPFGRRGRVEGANLEPRRGEPEVDEPIGVRSDLLLEALQRDVVPIAHLVPAADLDPAELRVIEGVPGDEALSAELLVIPSQELQIVLDGMKASQPGGHLPFERDAGGAERVPEFRDEGEYAPDVVQPADLGRDMHVQVPAGAQVEVGYRVVGRQLVPLLDERREGLTVGFGHPLVRIDGREEDAPAERMAGDVGDDVGTGLYGGDISGDLGRGGGVRGGRPGGRGVSRSSGKNIPKSSPSSAG